MIFILREGTMLGKALHSLQPSDPARRHFLAIFAAGAGRLTTLAISSTLLANCNMDNLSHQSTNEHDQNNANPQHHCFARGSQILTVDGDVPVENLTVGDWVVTTNAAVQVKWIGRQVLTKARSASWGRNVAPIRISRFAIDDQTPQRDLYLSQEHSLLIDGALIPVKYLVNGHSIVFDDDAGRSDTIEYFCVELDTHEVIYAEGTPAETFLYTGGQIAWDNLGEYKELYGTERTPMRAFAPIHRYSGGRAELRGLLRLTASHFVDVRDPIQIAYDRIAARAMSMAAEQQHPALWIPLDDTSVSGKLGQLGKRRARFAARAHDA
jgi:hypothetical protein